MTITHTPTADGLDPVRRTLIDRACSDADRIRAAARADADATTARAEAEARSRLDRARAEGTRDGELVAATERVRAHRHARAVVLAAQRDVYDELRTHLRAAAAATRDAATYPALRDRLVRRARDILGPQAEIGELPDGGIEGIAGGRRLVWSLPDLAERRLAAAGDDIVRLWSP
ncbi:F0F1-type ATP synthase membrane subunit b/b' [Rhodococcus sp. LBL1]|nr:F0F1-type ATP synthase membrane subunit b/b' [Rhodococcus sp. LBL1]MDH6684450.1 F0F1-type ATP synthase membrane subunit b/b' [Rhodococcus sp. LBL2]